jgi:hypothetical protein
MLKLVVHIVTTDLVTCLCRCKPTLRACCAIHLLTATSAAVGACLKTTVTSLEGRNSGLSSWMGCGMCLQVACVCCAVLCCAV